MNYPATKLNDWDYVFAITQEQINYGLRDMYNANLLPQGFSIKKNVFLNDYTLSGEFGQPTVQAIEFGLNICKFSIPVTALKITDDKTETEIPNDCEIVIKTSLTSIALEIKPEKGEYKGVYIDFKDENAVYDLKIEGVDSFEAAVITQMLKSKLQLLNNNTYLITSFQIGDEAFSLIPKLVEFTFNYNESDPDLSQFIVCSSVTESGPDVENRLTFQSSIIPEGECAAIWIGNNFLLGDIITPTLNKNLGTGYNSGYFKYNNKDQVYLTKNIWGKDKKSGRDVKLTKLTISPKEHALHIYNKIKIPNITFMDITGVGEGWSKIDFKLNKTNTSINIDTEIIETKSATEDVPWWAVAIGFVLGIIGVMITAIVIAIIDAIVKGKVDTGADSGLKSTLDSITTNFDDLSQQIPALQDSLVGGHLKFSGITLENDGSICLAIASLETKENSIKKQTAYLKTLDLEKLKSSGIALNEKAKSMLDTATKNI